MAQIELSPAMQSDMAEKILPDAGFMQAMRPEPGQGAREFGVVFGCSSNCDAFAHMRPYFWMV